MRRVLVLTATLVLLWMLVTQLNHALTELQIHLFAGGLFVAFPAVTQPLRSGFAASLLGGLVCDAHAPVTFGTHMLLFAAAHVTLHHVRDHVPRNDEVSAILVVLLTNLALFFVFSLLQLHAVPAAAALWPRLLVDLLCSQIVLTLATPWFFALQARSLALARIHRTDTA